MANSWKLTAYADKASVEAALLAHEDAFDWDPEMVIGGSEIAEDRPEDWRLEAWLPRQPTDADLEALGRLFAGDPPPLTAEELPETDWVTVSQQGLAPIREGRFHVHAPEVAADNSAIDFTIPASRAFGTGQHATTAGCLAMLEAMRERGVIVRNLVDVGTGTGLLAFAAMRLWPRSIVTASDIDAVCADVVLENAAANDIKIGGGAGQLAFAIAPGLDHPLLEARGPYDLIIANILAGPLIELAPDFGRASLPGGNLLIAGLLTVQEAAVRQAMFRAGFRLAARLERGDWSILWLRRRALR